MKEFRKKTKYNLKIFNDGSSTFIWTYPWKRWVPVSNQDYTLHSLWNKDLDLEKEILELEKKEC